MAITFHRATKYRQFFYLFINIYFVLRDIILKFKNASLNLNFQIKNIYNHITYLVKDLIFFSFIEIYLTYKLFKMSAKKPTKQKQKPDVSHYLDENENKKIIQLLENENQVVKIIFHNQ